MSSTLFFAPEKKLWSYDKYFKIYSKKLTPPNPPQYVMQTLTDFEVCWWFLNEFHFYLICSRCDDARFKCIRSRVWLRLGYSWVGVSILRELRLNAIHCDFIHHLNYMQCLIWCSVSICTIAFSWIYHFWIVQPDTIGQIDYFKKYMQFDEMIMRCAWFIL